MSATDELRRLLDERGVPWKLRKAGGRMSMISGLIDELRKSADEWNGSNMFELARMCSDAADTIWQLRDDLQRANAAVQDAEHDESVAWDRVRKAEAENAKLRVERDEWHRVAASKQDIIDHMRNANSENAKLREEVVELRKSSQTYDAENAKLRELVQDMWEGYNDPRCEECHLKDTPTCADCPICAREALVIDRMRDLGIEVDG